MSASQFVVSYGSSISYATITSGTPGSYTKVAQTVDVSAPASEVGDIKITNNDSPNNTHEYAPGLVEPGEVEFEVVFYASGHLTLMNFLGNQIVYSWKEIYTDGTTCVFPGYLKSTTLEGKTDDGAQMGKIKIKVTGKPVYTAGSGTGTGTGT